MSYSLMRQLAVSRHTSIMTMIAVQQKAFTQLGHTDAKSIAVSRIFRSCFAICTAELGIDGILFKAI